MTTARLAANIFGRTRVYYKGYEGSIEKDQDGTKWGKILKIRDLVTYEDAGEGIIKSFIDAVEDYIKTCEELGVEPDSPK